MGPNGRPLMDFFKCKVCGLKFGSKDKCLEHVRAHKKEGVNKEKCGICFQTFFTREALREHVQSHAALECKECGTSGFADAEELSQHMQMHQRARPTPNFKETCVFCTKVFHNKAEFSQHLNEHSSVVSNDVQESNGGQSDASSGNAAPAPTPDPAQIVYCCDICDTNYVSLSALNDHLAENSRCRELLKKKIEESTRAEREEEEK